MAPPPPGSRPGSSARPNTSAGVPYHHHHGSANGSKGAAQPKMPGTPRREQSHHRGGEKAVQDPGLKDYVGFSFSFLYLVFGC